MVSMKSAKGSRSSDDGPGERRHACCDWLLWRHQRLAAVYVNESGSEHSCATPLSSKPPWRPALADARPEREPVIHSVSTTSGSWAALES
jgi:hypothetical protein